MKKKLLLLLFVASVFNLNAQSLQIIDGEADSLVVGNAYTTADVVSHINIENVGTNTIDVLVKRIDKNINSLTDSNAICWQICFQTNISVSPPGYAITLQPGQKTTEVDFVGHVYPDMDGTPMTGDITYVFFDMNNPSDSVAFTVTYEVTTTFDIPEISQKERLSVFPNPARDNLNLEYDLTGVEDASFELVNLVGNVVYQKNLPSEKGTLELDLSKLKRGVYFYVLRNSQESMISRKLVVQ